jgi:OmpA-OmpF porin, OOP family
MPHANKNTAKSFALALAIAFIGATASAAAQEVLLFRRGETPDPNAIARILGGKSPDASGPRQDSTAAGTDDDVEGPAPITRGIRLAPNPASEHRAPIHVQRLAQPERERAPGSFALQVQFPFNSAELQPEMLTALDAIAEGIRRAGSEHRIVLEGHTDAIGSADYNLVLSKRRAEAVRNYLVHRQGIHPQLLVPVGRGKFAPLIPENPFAPENRRVQFRTGDA